MEIKHGISIGIQQVFGKYEQSKIKAEITIGKIHSQ